MNTLDFTPVPSRLIFSKLQTWLILFSVKTGTVLDLRNCSINAFISQNEVLVKRLKEGAGITTSSNGQSFELKNDLITINQNDTTPNFDAIATGTFKLDVVLTDSNGIDHSIANFVVEVKSSPIDSTDRVTAINAFEFDLKSISYSMSISAAESAQRAEAAKELTIAAKEQAVNLVSQVSLGTPKGSFARISALNTANPNHDFIYVTLNDGKWNYWNGTEFVAGGQYQTALGIVQESGSNPDIVMSQKAVLEFVNESKALFKNPIQSPISFEKFTNETGATVTYVNGVVTATHSNDFLVASSVEELREVELSYNKQWWCIGYGADGNALLLSTTFESGQLGKVRKMLPNGALSDVATNVLPNTEIPTNASRIRINTENNSITISYTLDNTVWTVWGIVAISAITGYSTKKLGFLSYKLYTDKTATVYSFKRVDTIENTLVISEVEETLELTNKFLLVGGGLKGLQKLSKSNAKQALGFVTQSEIELTKALFSPNIQPSISFEKVTSEGSTASVTYINGVITATHTAGYMGGFMIASSVEELREIIVSNNKQWLCLGYDSTGKAIIVSVNGDNIGKVLRIATTGVLSDATQLFPITRIPENATRIRINTENNNITISYTTDNVVWTIWGTVAISAITGYSTKKLGFLSYVGYPTPRTLTVYYFKRVDTEDTAYSLVLEGIEETTSDTDKYYLLGGGAKGLQKLKKPTVVPPNYGKIEYLGDSIIEQGASIIANFYSGIATVYNNGHSGYCYGVGGAGTLNNTTFLNAIISHAPSFVFLQAGTNDFGNNVIIGTTDSSNVSETCGGLNAIINTIQTSLPNCRIIIATPSPRYDGGSTQFQLNGIGKSYVEYVDAIIAVASRHSITVQDRWRSMGVNQYNQSTFTTDGLHLKPAGYKRMLDADLSLLKTLSV